MMILCYKKNIHDKFKVKTWIINWKTQQHVKSDRTFIYFGKLFPTFIARSMQYIEQPFSLSAPSPNYQFLFSCIGKRSQCSSLEAHWFLVAEDHGSNPDGGEKFPLSLLSCDPMIAIYSGINSWLCKVIHLWINL